jgi:hypothetical protein
MQWRPLRDFPDPIGVSRCILIFMAERKSFPAFLRIRREHYPMPSGNFPNVAVGTQFEKQNTGGSLVKPETKKFFKFA